MRTSSLVVLGLPAMGLAFAMTTVAAFVPVVLHAKNPSGTLAGAVVGGEGALALALPLVLGPLSDRTATRLPFVLSAVPLCVAGLVGVTLSATTLAIAASVLFFYVGYYVYYPPYRAMYLDVVPRASLGRSQGVQTLFREIGLGLALAGAPLALGVSPALPFVLAAAMLAVVTIPLAASRPARGPREPRPMGDAPAGRVVRDRRLVRLLAANALWELAIAGLRTFVVLYLVVGTGRSPAAASLSMVLVAAIAVVAAPIAGHLADRRGVLRVVRAAAAVFGCGLALPALTSSTAILLPALVMTGAGGAVTMTLPYAMLASRLPRSSHGAGAGLYDFSRGLGVLAGPLLAGAAIDLARPWLASTAGYGAMWLVCSASVLAGVALLPADETRARPGSSHVRQPSVQNPL